MSAQRNRTVVWGRQVLVGLAIVVGSVIVVGQSITVPNTFVNGTVADANQVNANFAALASNALNRNAGTMLGALNSQHVIPTTDNTYDLGSTTFYFRDLYVKRNAFINGLRGCDVRLTATSGTAVTTADVTAATSVYVTPYVSAGGGPAYCLFYDGSAAWTPVAVSEVAVTVPATTSTMYDVFCFNSSGTMACDAAVAWTNDTTRATALATQNGVYVKSGTTTRRYIGSFRTTTVSGQTEDSFAKRYLWSYYNRVKRIGRVLPTTDTWTYNTNTFRQAAADPLNQLDFVVGVAEVAVTVDVAVIAMNSNAGIPLYVAIGEDSTTTVATGCRMNPIHSPGVSFYVNVSAHLEKYPAVGRHTYVWLEKSGVTVTTTFRGDGGVTDEQSGIYGTIEG